MVDTFGNSGSCPLKDVVCLVIDEAHRAMGNYSYCVVVRKVQYFIYVHKIYSSSGIFLHLLHLYLYYNPVHSMFLCIIIERGICQAILLLPKALGCYPQLGRKQIFIIRLRVFL